jgi:hypothetical protein
MCTLGRTPRRKDCGVCGWQQWNNCRRERRSVCVLDSSINFTDVQWDKARHMYAISPASRHVFTLHSTGLIQTAVRSLSKAGSLAVLPVN